MTAVGEVERQALISTDHQVEELQRAIEAAVEVDAIDGEIVARAMETAREAARRISEGLAPEIDPEAEAEILKRLIGILTLQDREPLDLADEALVEAEAIRHVVRDLLDEAPAMSGRDPSAAVSQLEEWLPSLTIKQLSDLVGVQPRQLQRMRTGRGSYNRRLELVLRMVSILRRAWTDEGVYAWFHRGRGDLGGRAPIELLDEPGEEPVLIASVRAGRAQGGA